MNRSTNLVSHVRGRSLYLPLVWAAFQSSSICLAQPTTVNYHGVLEEDGVRFNGTAELKFVLVNEDGSESLWSHDDTSSNGSEPITSVEVQVTGGVFSEQLGEPPMAPLDASAVAMASGAALRVYVRTTGMGFEQLPDQPLGASPFAMSSAFADGAPGDFHAPGIIESGNSISSVGTLNPNRIVTDGLPTGSIVDAIVVGKVPAPLNVDPDGIGPLPFNYANTGPQFRTIKFGVGTADPRKTLDVFGDALIEGTSAAAGQHGFFNSGDQAWLYLGDLNHSIRAINGSGVRISTFGQPDLITLLQNGRVGIGTVSPGSVITNSKLDVIGGHIAVSNNFGFLSRNAAGNGVGAGLDTTTNDEIALFAAGAERVRVTGNGNVGIGTTTPNSKLSVNGDICATGNIVAFDAICASSDSRFKQNVTPVAGALDKIGKLRGVSYNWRQDEFPDRKFGDTRQIGFIAQEVEEVLPEVVRKGSDGYLAVDYGRVTPLLVEAVKEQQQHLDSVKAENAALRTELAEIKQALAQHKTLASND